MAISAKDVMELRKQTDCGMMECKKALTDAEGDFAKAIELLRERGLATAAKKAGRVAAEGMVYADYCAECKVGVVIEVNAETDFVAKNDKFVEFVKEVSKVIMQQNPADVEALMGCKMGEGTVDDALKQLILVIKENIKVRRFARYEGHCAAYVHGGGTHGVIVKFETSDDVAAKPEFAAFGKDIAMQVAAANPSYLNEAAVPETVIAKEKEIIRKHMWPLTIIPPTCREAWIVNSADTFISLMETIASRKRFGKMKEYWVHRPLRAMYDQSAKELDLFV